MASAQGLFGRKRLQVRSAAMTDVGRVREANEDSYYVSDELGLFVVADGMGGHVGGQMASNLAVETISAGVGKAQETLREAPIPDDLEQSEVPKLLADAVREACAAIYDAGQEDLELQGMGTTVTTMLLLHSHAFLAHVGDSRAYLQRKDRIIQITDDHSLINEQIKLGLITAEAARTSRLKNVITRSVGYERDVAVDTFGLPIEAGDKFLLCSDGLTNFVDDTEIGLALATLELAEVPERMVNLANERGGDDNITVVCLEVTD